MYNRLFLFILALAFLFTAVTNLHAQPKVNDTPGKPGEWGFHPVEGNMLEVTPPGFCWRPQRDAKKYEIQCARNADFSKLAYQADGIRFNVHTPPRKFDAGDWYWRFRFTDRDGETSAWSKTRAFSIADDANVLTLPNKADLIARIPQSHPRLFVRPGDIPTLRERAKTDLKEEFQALIKEADQLVNNPPPTQEPPKYGDIKRKSPKWLEIWWGNRRYTQKALGGAAELGFVYQISQKKKYGEAAKKLLLACAEWDPRGSTGYRYNDEAGMPYNYYFSRTYTFIHDLLTKKEKETCRAVMRVRGKEMYEHLYPRHLWKPYSSHSNRAWHFLGEIGIAFVDEIPEAPQWAWFAANVFTNVYPVWSDDDGGWHEGVSYWRSYIYRFTWWADIMKAAMGINAYDKPYFSQIGYYPMYLQPPGTQGGGFGDLTARRTSRSSLGLMSIVAAQAQNPHWQWYVDVQDGGFRDSGFVGFLRKSLKKPPAKAPTGLPSSRCFAGTGQAYLNHTILDAEENVEIIFKSSPFGTQSHGYESQNSFLLYAFGERLFIRTGRRDHYGSPHHTQWMWHTKSTNCITANGKSQDDHSAAAKGRILDFATGPYFDYVAGEASEAYEGNVKQFTRHILFAKPNVIVMIDELKTEKESTFEWYLHAPTKMEVKDERHVFAKNGNAACIVDFMAPEGLQLSQTDQFDPPPNKHDLTEYHLTAKTRDKTKEQTFVTVFYPHKSDKLITPVTNLQKSRDAFTIQATVNGKTLHVTFEEGKLSAQWMDKDGERIDSFKNK